MARTALFCVEMVVPRRAGDDLAVFGHAQAFAIGFVGLHISVKRPHLGRGYYTLDSGFTPVLVFLELPRRSGYPAIYEELHLSSHH